MFERNDLEAEAAWLNAKTYEVLQGTTSDETHRYDFILLVRITDDGRLVAKRTGTGRELIGSSRIPNQFDRDPVMPFDLETKCAFVTDGDLLVWRT